MPQANTEPSAERQPGRRAVPWAGVIFVATSLVGVATVLFHFLGVVIRQTYLSEFGVDIDLFPKSIDWLLVHGYYGIYSGVGMLFVAIARNVTGVMLLAVFIGLYMRWIVSPWNPFTRVDKMQAWLLRVPAWLRSTLLTGVWGALTGLLLAPLLLALFFLIGIPAKAGKAIGQTLAIDSSEDFIKGCQLSNSACTQLIKNGEPFGTGYLLDTSSSHLAYFDVALKRARVIPMEGLEMRATRPPKTASEPKQ